MGAHWSTLSAEDLAAVIRGLGGAYEPYALFLELNGIDGGTLHAMSEEGAVGPFSTKEGFNSVFAEFIETLEVPAAASRWHKLRLLREVQKSETAHPLPPQPNQAVVADAQARATQLAEDATITAAANAATTNVAPHAHDITDVQLQQMPEELRAFQPLIDDVFISALAASPELSAAEATFSNPQQQPTVQVRAAAAATVNKMFQQLTKAMQQKVKFRLLHPGVAERLQAVVQAGRKDFNEIYRSVWDMVTHDTDGVDRYKAAVAGAIDAAAPHSEERQEAQSVAELLQHAGQCKQRFDDVVNDVVAQCQGGVANVATAFPQARIPARLKKVSRIAEKLLLHPSGPITDVGRIFDVVRGMIRCQTMAQVAGVLEQLTNQPGITIVRVKDRFIANPSPGGWRDCQVCFYLNDSEHQHICELQIVHESLYNRRAQLPGHVVYGRVRNAEEMLEALTTAGAEHWLSGGVLERVRLGLPVDAKLQMGLQNIYLMVLFDATNGMSWRKSSEWGNLKCGSGPWYGVTTDKAGNVLKLVLDVNNLNGTSLIVCCLIRLP